MTVKSDTWIAFRRLALSAPIVNVSLAECFFGTEGSLRGMASEFSDRLRLTGHQARGSVWGRAEMEGERDRQRGVQVYNGWGGTQALIHQSDY